MNHPSSADHTFVVTIRKDVYLAATLKGMHPRGRPPLSSAGPELCLEESCRSPA